MLSFKLFENIQQAKKLLQDKKVKDFTDYNKISDLLSKNPNYIYQFTKWRYVDGASMEDIEKIINIIVNNKNVVDLLDKNIIDYTNFEHLIDDLTEARYKAIVNKFLTDAIWYKSLRNKIKDYLKTNKGKSNLIIDFLKLDESLQKEFLSSLKYYKENNVDADSFFDSIENFIEKKTLKDNELIDKLKSKGDLLKVVYNKDNIIIISTRDKSVVKEFGSEKWCIVYSDSFFGTYIGNIATQQYICFNLNIPKTNVNSLFGITVYPNGTTKPGARQNIDNKTMEMDEIVKSLNVGADVFKPLSDEELSQLSGDVLINSGLISRLTKEQISKLSIKDKIKHRLLSEEEKHNLDPDDKVINGYMEYLTEDDIKELDSEMIEKYEIPLSEEDLMDRDYEFKLRNGYFKYLNEAEIAGMNSHIKKDFKSKEEVETWYKSLKLIDKLDIIKKHKTLDMFIGKRDLIPFEDKYEMEITNEKLDDIYAYSELEDVLEYTSREIYYSDIVEAIGLSSDYAHNVLSGYSVDLYGGEEEWYLNGYINKENMDKITEIFGLSSDDLSSRFNFNFLAEFFFDYDFTDDIASDMTTKGNNARDEFLSLCPIKIVWSGGQEKITINLNYLSNYLEEYEKEYVNLFDWANSGTLFDSNKVDWDTLNEWQPYPSSEEAIDFNWELDRQLSKFEDDEEKKEFKTLPKLLLELGFSGDDNSQKLSMKKNGVEIKIDSIEISEDNTPLIKFTKNSVEMSVEMSGNLDYLKASITQGELF